ncbi:MAG: nuclear transport factor 2 family protein [Solirubrobacterales bacterium]|nr:nuclear transport factor 2 family protein [Solirubrobacterales bacterium]
MTDVEILKSLYEAINRGEIDRALEAMAQDVRWSRPPDVPITGTLEGIDQVERMWRAFLGSSGRFEIEPTSFEQNGDRVLAQVTMRGGGEDGVGSFEFSGAQVFRLAEGRILEVHEFRSLPEARAVLG